MHVFLLILLKDKSKKNNLFTIKYNYVTKPKMLTYHVMVWRILVTHPIRIIIFILGGLLQFAELISEKKIVIEYSILLLYLFIN